MNRLTKIILGTLAIVILVTLVGGRYLMEGMKEAQNLPLAPLDLEKIEDGSYVGSVDLHRWSTTVEVDVANHLITAIRIITDVDFRLDRVSSTLFMQVIQHQSLAVDIVAGTTATSKAYLKAIEAALKP